MNKKILFFLCAFAAVFLFIGVVLFTLGTQPKTDQQTSGPSTEDNTLLQSISLVSVSPIQNSVLVSGKKQIFTITFNNQPKNITTTLERTDVTNTSKPVTASFTLSEKGNALVLTTTGPIVPDSIYTLNVLYQNTPLVSLSYTTTNLLPSPVKQNNEPLKKYLPYNTASYSLRFDQNRNIYLFNFIYDPSKNDSLDVQYEQAKQDATDFIESKGIDIDSVIIEWNYS